MIPAAEIREILDECESDFHVCERCGHQDDDATRESNLYLLLRSICNLERPVDTPKTATEIKILEQASEWLKQSEARRDAFVAELQRAVDALKPIDDAAHTETAGRATEIIKALIARIQR